MNDFEYEIYYSLCKKDLSIIDMISSMDASIIGTDMYDISYNPNGDSMDFSNFTDISEIEDIGFSTNGKYLTYVESSTNNMKTISKRESRYNNILTKSIQVSTSNELGLSFLSKDATIQLAQKIYNLICNNPRYLR